MAKNRTRKNFVPHGSFTEVSFKRVSTIYDHKQTTFQVVVVYRWHLPSKYVIKHQKHGGTGTRRFQFRGWFLQFEYYPIQAYQVSLLYLQDHSVSTIQPFQYLNANKSSLRVAYEFQSQHCIKIQINITERTNESVKTLEPSCSQARNKPTSE